MSSSSNNFRATSGNWETGRDYGAYTSNHDELNRVNPMFSRSRSVRVTPEVRAGMLDRRPSFVERSLTGPNRLASVPGTNLSSLQILVLDNNTAREAYPRPRQVMIESPPAIFTSQRNMQVPRVQEDSRVAQDENKLRREIYNPGPKRLLRKVSLYYRDKLAKDSLDKLGKEVDEEGKRCAICLDDFEAGQEVMLTPCNHMFHEDCITPWMKSHSQCPVCRYEFGEQTREHASNFNHNNIASDLITRELLSIARAMEEAFLWGNDPR